MDSKPWIKADLHVHTVASDGKLTPEEVLRLARKLGLHALAITDHDTDKGVFAAKKLERLYNVLVIPGFEYTKRSLGALAHILVYGISPGETEQLVKLEILELLDECKERSLVCVLAHPFGRLSVFSYPLTRIIGKLRSKLSGLEVANGAAGTLANLRALRCYASLNPGHWIATAGSDSHEAETLGSAYLELWGDPRSTDEFLDALKSDVKSIHFSRNVLYPYIRFIKNNIKKYMHEL